MTLTNDYIRKNYLVELHDRELWLDTFRSNTPLSAKSKMIRWVAAADVVMRAATKHYRRRPYRAFEVCLDASKLPLGRQTEYELHLDRILMFIDFLRAYPERPVNWCVTSFTLRFGVLDNRMQQGTRRKGGASFKPDCVYSGTEDAHWNYGTYTGTHTGAERPAELDAMVKCHRLINETYKELGVQLTQEELFGVLVEMGGAAGPERLKKVARDVVRYYETMSRNNASSLEQEIEWESV